MLAVLLASMQIAFSIYLRYVFTDRLERILGMTRMSVLLRLTSFLLVCIGVQIAWSGATSLLASVPIRRRAACLDHLGSRTANIAVRLRRINTKEQLNLSIE